MSRHALISSHNPVSRQVAVPCMTIRLTPQIISQLNKSPPPKISFCIKDRVLTIGDVRHTLQAFVEDPSLCEVYYLKSDRLVQVGNLEHKLIVQREVNTKNTAGITPKVSESSSAHSNPLAPRQNLTTSQRVKRPRNAGPNKSSSSKRPAVSTSTTPRRLISHSPMEPRPSSPERQPSSSSGSCKSSKINSSLPLRDQVLHLLAIQPMSAAGIGRRLLQPTKNLATILKTIAQYEIPGRYRLRDDLLTTVRIDLWPYSEQEKELVLKNIESVAGKNSEIRPHECLQNDLTSLCIDGDLVSESNLQTPKPSSKNPSPQRSESLSKKSSPQTDIQPKKPISQPDSSKQPDISKRTHRVDESVAKLTAASISASAKQESNPSAIESHEEYLSCRSRFEQMYPRYSAVDSRLKEIAAEFNSLAAKLDSPQCPPSERRKIQNQVKELYAQLKPEVNRLKAEFNIMHDEMSILKTRIRSYVDNVLTS